MGRPSAGGVVAQGLWPSGVALRAGDFLHPGLACEIAFRFGRDLAPRRPPYALEVLRAVLDACRVSIEIIDDRHEDLSQVHIILGPPVGTWPDLDFADLAGIIRCNGQEVSRGLAVSWAAPRTPQPAR